MHFRSVLALSVSTVALTMSAPALAQDAPASPEPEQIAQNGAANPTDTIVVTGTRIRRPDLESTVPVAVVGQQALLQDAQQNVSDTLNELPSVATGNTRTNSNFLTSGNGVATVNLRGAGANRTLVLQNGRRFIAGFAGSSSVDLNNIPTDFIERVEIVTGGSSAVYGSDAVAGVVNFIMKDRYDGIGIRAQGSITDENDNERYLVSVSAGEGFFDDTLQLLGNFTWDKDKGLPSRNRSISKEDCGIDGTCGPANFSTFADQGRFQVVKANGAASAILTGGNSLFTFDKQNALTLGFPVGFGFNRDNERFIAVPIERKLATGILKYEVKPNFNYFAEVTFSRTDSNSSLEPTAIAISDFGAFIQLDNPFIPTEILNQINAANADADPGNNVAKINARRRSNDIFDRSNTNERKTLRLATGFNGNLADRFDWEVSYVYGRMHDFTASEDINVENYVAALDAIRVGPGNVLGVDIVCRDQAARDRGCIPMNIFGRNTVDPKAAAFVTAEIPRSDDIINHEHVLTGSISGPIFSAWAGDVSAAIGGEFRHESTREDLDDFTNQGLNSGNQLADLSGQFDVWEVFGELNFPLVSDQSWTKYFGLTGAVRYSDYSTVGSVVSWNAGLEWEPVNGVRFRAMHAVANRAPNISELFSQPSQTFAAVNDPCDGVTATSDNDGFGDACRDIPAIAAAIQANGKFEYTLADLQGIDGFIGGNPDLQEETAKTNTVGVVLTPSFLPGFSATVDYYDIRIKDIIALVGRNTSITECLKTGLAVFCDNVIRSGQTGFITQVNDRNRNASIFHNQGIDVMLNYDRQLGIFTNDRLNLSLNYTYLIDNKTKSDPAAETIESAGTWGRGASRHSALFRGNYRAGKFTVGWSTNFLSGHEFVPDVLFATNFELVEKQNQIDDYWLHDMQLRYDYNKKIGVYFNIDNVFDTKPQLLPGAAFAGAATGLETSPDFDVFGRRFTAGIRVGF